ncbi:MAG: hypothetical protein IMF26_02455 [Candidatus Fermentithermobacillus carboniphilus]|uniref:Thioredoxin-like fold domain-containing protein n=1 Tax=Candidatus Fermentithermobacillus carboniphilus TaxID=3085328 RepID=A0AAT9LDH2_9FIRM|nr:MAG: hypothetical protein IMF26_02455 [Candidatus Fermentithermobacillus carboniphilus]
MGRNVVVVLYGCCPGTAHELALSLREKLNRSGKRAEVVEAEFSSCLYWDGEATCFISPVPVCLDLKTRVIVSRDAFLGDTDLAVERLVSLIGLN